MGIYMYITCTGISRDSSDGIATVHELDGWASIPGRGKRFYVLHSVETGSGAHPAAVTKDTGGTFPVIRATGA
jgi:hypothetical protein